jgi:hypothetical protein
MSKSKMILVSLCLMALSQLVWSQNASTRSRGIPGYLDPSTGMFTAKAQPAEVGDVEPPVALTEYYGKWTVTLTIQVSTTPASGDIIGCEADLEVSAAPYGYSEGASGVSSAVKNGVATCTLAMPYAWYISTPVTDDSVFVSYTISLNHVFTQGSLSESRPDRTTSHTIGSFAMPAPGAQTTTTASARI